MDNNPKIVIVPTMQYGACSLNGAEDCDILYKIYIHSEMEINPSNLFSQIISVCFVSLLIGLFYPNSL